MFHLHSRLCESCVKSSNLKQNERLNYADLLNFVVLHNSCKLSLGFLDELRFLVFQQTIFKDRSVLVGI